MTTIVVLSINGTPLRVECDGLARDSLLPKNVVLTGCKELDTEARDGKILDTKLWSVPESIFMSYAVGRQHTEEAIVETPALAHEPPPAIEVVQELTDEQKQERRKRYAERDEATNKRRAAAEKRARAAKKAISAQKA
jgi:hypothetical protein